MRYDDSNKSYSINLSGMSLGSRKLLDVIISELDSSDIAPERVCFEITETAAIRNHTSACLLYTSDAADDDYTV